MSVPDDDRLHAIDSIDANDFGVRHHRQLAVVRVRASAETPAKALYFSRIARTQHDEHALAALCCDDGRNKRVSIRWLEWGMRSYENFLGLAVLLFAVAVRRTAWIPRPIAYLMSLSGLTYLMQGWLAGSEGFSETHTIAIVLAEVLNVVWMIWLVVVARRTQDLEPASPGR